MSTPVVTTTIDSNVSYARELMERKNVNAIPVVDLGEQIHIRGIVTSKDIFGIPDESIPVTEVMSTDIFTVGSNSSIQAAAEMMFRNKIHHLVVMEDGRLVGMVSSMDFVRLIAEEQLPDLS